MSNKWPQLDYLGWRETCSALHLYLQIAGKYRLAHTPLAQPFLERDPLCHAARPDILADPRRSRN
nr:DUF5996 family protein [Bradyrhizobium retamae]